MNDRVGNMVEAVTRQEKEKRTPCIAVLSPELAWKLLTTEEQRLLLVYLEKIRERDKQAVETLGNNPEKGMKS